MADGTQHETLFLALAHPDDESFFFGGTIAKYVEAGWRVVLYCATYGLHADADGEKVDRRTKRSLREKELERSAQILGIHRVIKGDIQHGELADVPCEEVITELINLYDEERPQRLITFPPDGITGDDDHRRMSKCATEAFVRWHDRDQELYYGMVPDWLLDEYDVDEGVSERVDRIEDVRPYLIRKLKAIEAHQSQTYSRTKLAAFSEEELAHLLGFERYTLVRF